MYGPTRQSYMVPVVEYYLQGMVATDRAGTRYVTEDDGLDVEVAFVCTPTLDSDSTSDSLPAKYTSHCESATRQPWREMSY